MKIKLIAVLVLFLPFFIMGQSISVQSFKHLAKDMDARVNHSKTDQNGDICAIIKVVSTEQGFTWEGDMFGIVATEHKTAEYWLYVPNGVKRLTIKHPHLGVLRDYNYPESIKEANVYEMILTTGKVMTTVELEEISMQWLVISSEPSEADVFIDNQYVGVTPFQKRMQIGAYEFRIEKFMYHSSAGKVELKREDRKTIETALNPAFGYLSITSKPEGAAKIEIDGKPIKEETPLTSYKLLSGSHRITLKKVMYDPKTINFEISDGEQKELTLDLVPNFASININTNPKATIYIDGQEAGKGNFSGRLIKGLHSLEAKLSSHQSDKQQIEVRKGETKEIKLEPRPITGSLNIISTPIDATIIIDGKDYGKTPRMIQELLIGNHQLEIKKYGYKSILETVHVSAEYTKQIKEELQKSGNYSANKKSVFKDSRDSKEYEIVIIGNQTWFAENLNYEMDNSWCYDNKSENCDLYGRLYAWKAAIDACPTGWHLPSNKEWTVLEKSLGMSQSEAEKSLLRGTDEGRKLKSISGWNYGSSSNSSGFTALPGGYRGSDNLFNILGFNGSWWTSSANTSEGAWARFMNGESDQVGRSNYNKSGGFSVRCLKD